MPTNLTQNYKVYPQFQQNVTKTSSKSFRTISERKRETHPHLNTQKSEYKPNGCFEKKQKLQKGVQFEALGRLL